MQQRLAYYYLKFHELSDISNILRIQPVHENNHNFPVQYVMGRLDRLHLDKERLTNER